MAGVLPRGPFRGATSSCSQKKTRRPKSRRSVHIQTNLVLVLVVPPLQRRAIVITLIVLAGLIGRRRSPQAGLSTLLLIHNLAAGFLSRGPRLDLVGLRGSHQILRLSR